MAVKLELLIRIISVAKWKLDIYLCLEEWENKHSDYEIMAKLTTYLRNRSIMKLKGNKYYGSSASRR